MYESWRSAVPRPPFPFEFRGKGNKLAQTWADVRQAALVEGISPTLHYCTAHITPTAQQSAIIIEGINAAARRER